MPEKIETSHKMTITLESFRNEDLARAIETFHELRDEKAVLLQNKLKVTLTIEGFAAAPLEDLLADLQEHVHGHELKVDGKVDRKYPFSDLSLGKVILFVRQRITPGTPMDSLWRAPATAPVATEEPEPAEEEKQPDEEPVEEEVTA
jgi:hypothetical protein